MTIDKAIETLALLCESYAIIPESTDGRAIQLGREALEEVKYYRQNPVSYVLKLLPGETEE